MGNITAMGIITVREDFALPGWTGADGNMVIVRKALVFYAMIAASCGTLQIDSASNVRVR